MYKSSLCFYWHGSDNSIILSVCLRCDWDWEAEIVQKERIKYKRRVYVWRGSNGFILYFKKLSLWTALRQSEFLLWDVSWETTKYCLYSQGQLPAPKATDRINQIKHEENNITDRETAHEK